MAAIFPEPPSLWRPPGAALGTPALDFVRVDFGVKAELRKKAEEVSKLQHSTFPRQAWAWCEDEALGVLPGSEVLHTYSFQLYEDFSERLTDQVNPDALCISTTPTTIRFKSDRVREVRGHENRALVRDLSRCWRLQKTAKEGWAEQSCYNIGYAHQVCPSEAWDDLLVVRSQDVQLWDLEQNEVVSTWDERVYAGCLLGADMMMLGGGGELLWLDMRTRQKTTAWGGPKLPDLCQEGLKLRELSLCPWQPCHLVATSVGSAHLLLFFDVRQMSRPLWQQRLPDRPNANIRNVDQGHPERRWAVTWALGESNGAEARWLTAACLGSRDMVATSWVGPNLGACEHSLHRSFLKDRCAGLLVPHVAGGRQALPVVALMEQSGPMGFWLEPPREGGSRPLPFPDDLKKRGAAEFSLLDSILESLQYLKACKVNDNLRKLIFKQMPEEFTPQIINSPEGINKFQKICDHLRIYRIWRPGLDPRIVKFHALLFLQDQVLFIDANNQVTAVPVGARRRPELLPVEPEDLVAPSP
ncbi:unnamed protein product [Effrenium voratum]|nr:unnamed protein product [Effrenium voratum]